MGPNLATIAHHWTAIYEGNVDIIIMLTKLREKSSGSHPSTEKCAQYWPSTKETPLRAGCFEITMLDEEDFTPEIKKRIFIIKNVGSTNGSSEEKRITQLQYTGWPDYGVPDKADHLTNLVKKVRYIIQSNQNKISTGEKFTILAHCSAGVGRTGTFIAMYQMMDQIEDLYSTAENNSDKTQYIDIFKAVLFFRSKRVEMVQSWAQYQYLYNSVADYAKQIKSINEGSDEYVDYNDS
jgi:protein tyrosine phosphatase